jgi:hypothetical protein
MLAVLPQMTDRHGYGDKNKKQIFEINFEATIPDPTAKVFHHATNFKETAMTIFRVQLNV